MNNTCTKMKSIHLNMEASFCHGIKIKKEIKKGKCEFYVKKMNFEIKGRGVGSVTSLYLKIQILFSSELPETKFDL